MVNTIIDKCLSYLITLSILYYKQANALIPKQSPLKRFYGLYISILKYNPWFYRVL